MLLFIPEHKTRELAMEGSIFCVIHQQEMVHYKMRDTVHIGSSTVQSALVA